MTKEQFTPDMEQIQATSAEYQRLVKFLDELIDVVGENQSHLLASLMEVMGVLIENYEDQYVPELSA